MSGACQTPSGVCIGWRTLPLPVFNLSSFPAIGNFWASCCWHSSWSPQNMFRASRRTRFCLEKWNWIFGNCAMILVLRPYRGPNTIGFHGILHVSMTRQGRVQSPWRTLLSVLLGRLKPCRLLPLKWGQLQWIAFIFWLKGLVPQTENDSPHYMIIYSIYNICCHILQLFSGGLRCFRPRQRLLRSDLKPPGLLK